MDHITTKELLPVIGTLLGALGGFMLGAVYQNVRELRQRRRFCKELIREVQANLYALPQKRQTIEFMLANIDQRRIFSGDSVPASTVIYTHHYPAVAPYLSQEERNLLHVVYSTLNIVDSAMASFEPTVLGTTGLPGGADNVILAYAHKLKDMLQALADQETLMKSFLAGKPIDVYHMGKPFEELKKARFMHDARVRDP